MPSSPRSLENAFIGRATPPRPEELAVALGPARSAWDQLLAHLASAYEATLLEWRSYSRKAGWSLRVQRGKRTLVWLSPGTGCFRAGFILGQAAVQAARESGLSAAARRAFDEAVIYSEGTGVNLPVRSERDLPAVRKLARAKHEN